MNNISGFVTIFYVQSKHIIRDFSSMNVSISVGCVLREKILQNFLIQ
jgi:hypothetical protein